MQLLYQTPALQGFLVQEPETPPLADETSAIYFSYIADAKSPTVKKSNE
jgi:hypothetical protein